MSENYHLEKLKKNSAKFSQNQPLHWLILNKFCTMMYFGPPNPVSQ